MSSMRIKKMNMDLSLKSELKKFGYGVKYDRWWKVYVITPPENVKLIQYQNSSLYFLINKYDGKSMGHVYSPYSLSGGLLTFVP